MTVAVLDGPRAVKISLAGPLGRAGGILLWGAVAVLVFK